MAKSYTLELEHSKFKEVIDTCYLITQKTDELDYQDLDYILLVEYENVQNEDQVIKHNTDLYQMVQISKVITDEGLKEDHVLLFIKKLN